MPKQYIDKDTIVDQAYELAEREGLAFVSVRGVADACGVAVGSIYNYFPSKDDLIAALIERFFRNAFFEDFCHPTDDENFLAYCERLYASMRDVLSQFRSNWLSQIQDMGSGARTAGKKLEAERLVHIRRGLEHVLAGDPGVRADALTGELTAEALCAFVLASMIDALRAGDESDSVLFALVDRAIYR